MGYDNISFNSTLNQVYFIDVENLLVVDMNHSNDLDDYYEKKFEDCGQFGDCLSYDPKKLCSASKGSDLNFYSICRNILSEFASDRTTNLNFLHSIPKKVDEKFKLNELLNECTKLESKSDKKFQRLELVQLLIDNLNLVLHDLDDQ